MADNDKRTETPAEGSDVSAETAKESLQPGAHTKPENGLRGDVGREEPYDEEPADFRMVDQPLQQ